MKSNAEKVVLGVSMPGAGGRRAWLLAAPRGSKLVEAGELDLNRSAYLLGAKDVVSIPMWINSPDPALWDKLVRMELAQQKIDFASEAGCLYEFRPVAEDGARRQMAVAVMSPEALARLPEEEEWGRYDLAAHYLPLPRDGMVVCREECEWTLLFSKGGRLAYLHPLGCGPLDRDGVQEAFCLSRCLQEQGMVERQHTVHLWNREPEQDEAAQLLERWFGVAVERADPPVPERQEGEAVGASFDPPEVARRRRRKERQAVVVRALAVTAAFYGAVVLGGGYYLHQREVQVRSSEARVARLMPDAARMQRIQAIWDELKEAVEPDCYPWELFHRCAVLLPFQGVRLTHFEVDGARLVIQGEATSTALAIQYRNALLKASALAQYRWESPQPAILPGNRAKFQAVGQVQTMQGSSH